VPAASERPWMEGGLCKPPIRARPRYACEMNFLDPHRLAEERSIALHAAVAAKLRADPALVKRARQRLERWAAEGLAHPEYVSAWREVLLLPLDEICRLLSEPTERMRALRQATPFAGVLTPRERWALHRAAASYRSNSPDPLGP
jgi:hypothetical protein